LPLIWSQPSFPDRAECSTLHVPGDPSETMLRRPRTETQAPMLCRRPLAHSRLRGFTISAAARAPQRHQRRVRRAIAFSIHAHDGQPRRMASGSYEASQRQTFSAKLLITRTPSSQLRARLPLSESHWKSTSSLILLLLRSSHRAQPGVSTGALYSRAFVAALVESGNK